MQMVEASSYVDLIASIDLLHARTRAFNPFDLEWLKSEHQRILNGLGAEYLIQSSRVNTISDEAIPSRPAKEIQEPNDDSNLVIDEEWIAALDEPPPYGQGISPSETAYQNPICQAWHVCTDCGQQLVHEELRWYPAGRRNVGSLRSTADDAEASRVRPERHHANLIDLILHDGTVRPSSVMPPPALNIYTKAAYNSERVGRANNEIHRTQHLAQAEEEPADGQPAGQEPAGQAPTNQEPTDQETADEEPADEEPADEDSAGNEPAEKEHGDEEQAHKRPNDEDPAGEEQADEESGEDWPGQRPGVNKAQKRNAPYSVSRYSTKKRKEKNPKTEPKEKESKEASERESDQCPQSIQ